ncbi:hypothetical protein ACQKP3_14915 [Vibrio sp. DNB22_10_4]
MSLTFWINEESVNERYNPSKINAVDQGCSTKSWAMAHTIQTSDKGQFIANM